MQDALITHHTVLLARNADSDISTMAKRSTDNPPSPAVRKAVATIKRLLVNRTDRFGSYFVQDRGQPEERVCPFTAPGRKKTDAAKNAKKTHRF